MGLGWHFFLCAPGRGGARHEASGMLEAWDGDSIVLDGDAGTEAQQVTWLTA